MNEFRDETSKEPEQDVPRSRPEPFSRQIARIFWLLLAGLVVGGGIFLATWDIPPPSGRVEQVLPDAQFPQ